MNGNQQIRGLGCIESERNALITGYPDTHFLVTRYPDNRFAIFSTLFTNFPSTPVENVRQIRPFYAKQTQFSPFFAPHRRFYEKTNPIRTQFKPNLTQNKPNLTQNKANSNPILSALEGHRTEIRCRMSETTCLRQLQFKPVFYIIIGL